MSAPYFAVCPRGLEPYLVAELQALGARCERPVTGGVAFDGDQAIAYGANLHSRIASRVLARIDSARYRDDDDVYKLAARQPWETLIDPLGTLRVDVTAIRSPLRSLNFVTLRVKDGIVDRLRTVTGDRPSIDTHDPQTRVFGFLDEREATLYRDLSGQSLFKRGWRSNTFDKGAAPIKENLAAGMLLVAGWTPDKPLYDPFCGSGTIVIEAAQMALDIAPGLSRSFGFERLPDFNRGLWQKLHDEAVRRAQAGAAAAASLRIAASDIDPSCKPQVAHNAQRAGLPADLLRVSVRDFAEARPPWDEPGIIVSNPPYGQRIDVRDGAGSTVDMGSFIQTLRQHFGGWTVNLLSSERDLPRQLHMKERRKTPLFNGPIECRLFAFEIFAARPASSVTHQDDPGLA